MKRISVLLLAIFLVVVSLVGCGPKKEEGTTATNTKEVTFPLTVKDSTGKDVTINKKPERIISIVPSNTEIAYALGIGDKIVGVSTYDNYPAEVKTKEKIGDLTVSAEKVVSLKPDLVLANSLNSKAVDNLRKLGLTVLVTDAKTFDEVYTSIDTIGKATGTAVKASEIVAQMKKDVEAIKSKVSSVAQDKKQKVYVEVDTTYFTTGKGTFMNEMIDLAGGVNIAADLEGWKQLSEEQIIQRNPDVIFDTYAYMDPSADKKIKERAKWQSLNAIKSGKVFNLDSDLVSRPGPRLAEALKQVAKFLHPELFK